tara:strand:- start:1445 stop:1792 length:348 start_codon:yes stop_codon:yes gene_type:complete
MPNHLHAPNLFPYQAMLLIVQSPAPKLSTAAASASKHFHSFLASALNKDPAERPSAADLLTHEFVARGGGQEALRLWLRGDSQEKGGEHTTPAEEFVDFETGELDTSVTPRLHSI